MKLQNIKLNNLAENNLVNREMKQIVGGAGCQCSCHYAGEPGGSSTNANGNANAAGGKTSIDPPKIELPEVVIPG